MADYLAAAKRVFGEEAPKTNPSRGQSVADYEAAAARAFKQDESGSPFNASISSAIGADPNKAARAQRAGQALGVGDDVAERNLEEAEAEVRKRQLAGIEKDAPVTAGVLSDPKIARVAHDDVENLSAIEKAWNWYADDYVGGAVNIAKGLPAGVAQFGEMSLRGVGEEALALRRLSSTAINAVFGEGVIENLDYGLPWYLDPAKALIKGGEAIGDVKGDIRPDEQGWQSDLGMGLGQVAGQITLAILTRGTGSAASLLTMTGQGGAIQSDMAKDADAYGTVGADVATLGGAGITAVTEKFGLDMLLKYVPAKVKNEVFQVLAGAGSEGSQEILEQVLQNLTAYALYDPNQTIFDAGLFYDGSIGAGVGGVTSSVIGVGSAYQRSRRAQRAMQAREGLLDANDKAMKSELNTRAPEKAAAHRIAVLERQGINSVSIDAQAVQDMLQGEASIDDPELAQKLGLTEEGLLEAIEIGGEVTIGRDAFGSYIYGTERFNDVIDHIRIREDEMTPAEGREFQENGLADEMARLNDGFDLYGEDIQRQAREIQDDVESMLLSAGRPSDEAQYGALLMASEYVTTAERSGVAPLELWAEDKVRIVGPENVSRETVDDLTILLDKARSTDPEAFLGLSKTPMIDWLVSQGGIDPDGPLAEEMRLMDITPRTRPGLFKKGGIGSADNIVQSEVDLFVDDTFGEEYNGYIPEEAIINAVQEEMLDRPKRTAQQTADLESFSGDVDDLNARLGAVDMSLADSDDDIRAALRNQDIREFYQKQAAPKIQSVIQSARDSKTSSDKVSLFPLPEWLLDTVKEKGNIDLTGFVASVDASAVRHTLNKHGDAKTEASRGQSAITEDDIASIPEIILSPDQIIFGGKNKRGQDLVGFVKTMPDGSVLVVEEVRTGRKELALASMRKTPGRVDGKKPSAPNVRNALPEDEIIIVEKSDFVNFERDPEGIKKGGGDDEDGLEDERFDQPDASGYEPRGSITLDARETLIRMGKAADRSTFLHEASHLFLEHVKRNSTRFGETNEQFVEDWDTVKKWWGDNAENLRAEAIRYARMQTDDAAVTALGKMSEAEVREYVRQGDLTGQTFNQGGKRGEGSTNNPLSYLTRAMHEQWARGAEDYYRTGQAPSVALQDAFNRFRAWLVSIYKAVSRRGNLDVQFSTEVKAVMDRLLATDEEIALVNEQYDLKPLFKDAASIGMTPSQWRGYQREAARDVEERKTRQLKKHLNEIERETKKWWMEESARVREEEIEPDIHNMPVYRALYGLAKGTMPNGEAFPDGMRPSRLDRKAVIAVLENEESLKRLPKVGSTGVVATKRERGVHPDIVAQQYGYESGRDLLLDLMSVDRMEDAIQKATDARMKSEYGDLLNKPEAIEAALESSHTGKRGDVLAMELNALREGREKMKPAFVRKWAKDRIAQFKIRDISPAKFLTLERKHGREAGKAFRDGDRIGAMRAKFREMAHFFMSHEAYKVRDEIEKSNKFLGKYQKSKKQFKSIDAEYVERIQSVLALYDLGPRLSEKKELELELKALNDFIKKAEEEDGAILEVPERIQYSRIQKHYKDMTLDEYRELVDFIKSLEAQGRLKKTALVNGETRLIEDMEAEILERLDRMPQKSREARRVQKQNEEWYDKGLSGLAGFDAALRKMEFLLEKIDGEKLGPAKRYIFQVFADAEAKRQDISRKVTKTILDAQNAIPKDVRGRFAERIVVPELGREFRRSDLIMMALNTGNESNLQKMIDGSKKDAIDGSLEWTQEGVDAALKNLGKAEWDFVQTVWDSFEGMYPEVEAIYRRENGVAPEKIESRAVETPHGTYRGGYFPMMYDVNRSAAARDIDNKTAIEQMQSSIVKGSVNSSMTKSRTGFSAPVMLDIEALPNHVERTAHFITHYEPVRTVRKLMNRLEAPIQNKLGKEYVEAMKGWFNDVASNGQRMDPGDMIGKWVEFFRTNATVAIMGISYTTMSAQILGYSNSIDGLAKSDDGTYNKRRAASYMLKGLHRYLSNPVETTRKVFSVSGEMRNRLDNMDREIRHARKQLAGKKGAWKKMQNASLSGIAYVQLYMVDLPTWVAGYNKALNEGYGQKDAVLFADSIIRTTQTAGGVKDLSAIQRKRGVTTGLTMFYSYFNLLYNIEAEMVENTDVKKLRDWNTLFWRTMIILAAPAAVESIMKMDFPDDDETWAGHIAEKAALYALSSPPMIRDLVGIAEGFGYSATPLDSLGESISRAIPAMAQAIDEGMEVGEGGTKSIVSVLGFGLGLPATQINRLVDAYYADETEWFEWFMGDKVD